MSILIHIPFVPSRSMKAFGLFSIFTFLKKSNCFFLVLCVCLCLSFCFLFFFSIFLFVLLFRSYNNNVCV